MPTNPIDTRTEAHHTPGASPSSSRHDTNSLPNKPPPIDLTHLPPPAGQTSGQVASSSSGKSFSPRRAVPTYPRWAHKSDSPRLAKTIHDFALFLSSLPVPVHRWTPRIAARVVATVLAKNNLMATNLAFDIALLFWRLIINIFFRSIQPRGAWRIPTDGPVIFVGAPHHNQVSLMRSP